MHLIHRHVTDKAAVSINTAEALYLFDPLTDTGTNSEVIRQSVTQL